MQQVWEVLTRRSSEQFCLQPWARTTLRSLSGSEKGGLPSSMAVSWPGRTQPGILEGWAG